MQISLRSPSSLTVILVLLLGINQLYAVSVAKRVASYQQQSAFPTNLGFPPATSHGYQQQNNNNNNCSRSCATCSGNTTNDCLTCPSSYSLQVQTCANITGYIQVNNVTDGTVLGYIADNLPYVFGVRGLTTNVSDALYVSFNNASSPFDLVIDNGGDATYTLLGAIASYLDSSNDLGAGSGNYAFIGDTSHTPPNSSAQTFGSGQGSLFNQYFSDNQPIESAIWLLSPSTNELIPQWVNTDGSEPTIYIIYGSNSQDQFVITGDVNAYYAKLNAASTSTQVNFTFVQTSAQNCSGNCVANSCYPNYGGGFGNPYSGPYGNPYGNRYGNPYGLLSGLPFGSPSGLPFGSPSSLPFGSPSNLPFGSPSGLPFGSPSGLPFGSPSGLPGGLSSGFPSGFPSSAFPSSSPFSSPYGYGQNW